MHPLPTAGPKQPTRRLWVRATGEPFPPGARTVDPPSPFANPFDPAKYGHDRALDMYRAFLRGNQDATDQALADGWSVAFPPTLVAMIRTQLRGLDLVCTQCPAGAPWCHTTVLLDIARGETP